jgi:hypothetical protein
MTRLFGHQAINAHLTGDYQEMREQARHKPNTTSQLATLLHIVAHASPLGRVIPDASLSTDPPPPTAPRILPRQAALGVRDRSLRFTRA